MTLMSRVLEHIKANPGITAGALADAFPGQARSAVQHAAYRLFLSEYVLRTGSNKKFSYSVNVCRPMAGEAPVEDSIKTKKLIATAQELEEKGLYSRAATIWFEAFAASRVISEREHCLKRRRTCVRNASRIVSGERIYDLPGRFDGDL